MGDAYWRYAEARQLAAAVPPLLGKRARPDFDVPGGHDLTGYYGRDDARGAPRAMREVDSLGASYERYLRGQQLGSLPIDPRIMGSRGADLAVAKRQSLGVGGGRPETPLPPDASQTLFVEGLPANCSRREVAHIFRPFVGYKEVRLVTKDSRHARGDALVLCFVDFLSPAHAATAMDALQGYRFDEQDRDSISLRLQFARHPGARSGGGHRGRR
ncbi:RNA-binding protein 2-like [Heracleum sosnowskyi]|uniref:RNA-binding protein 2-like n=1 Tax=Heracleum sosnowskyi TaxID=360622 RepID=A0AAD8HHP1_9APIA|nr:RNA-binding protein 2-like [Heracleum sosnowskyi]